MVEEELGAALVSARAFSEPGAVVVEAPDPTFVSFLLESCGSGVAAAVGPELGEFGVID